MNILITGSTGFVGRHLVPKLVKNHQVMELTIELEVSEILYGNKTQKAIVTESQNDLILRIASFKPDIVIHLASYLTSMDDYNTMCRLIDTNILFLCRVLDAVKNTEIKLFINTGTFAEYFKGDGVFQPAYLYSATKTAARSLIDYYSTAYKFNYTTIVPYTIYGGNDSQKKVIDVIYDSLFSEEAVELSEGNQILDFVHIEDVTDFYLTIVDNYEKIPNKQNFQLGTGVGTTLREVSNIFEKQTGREVHIAWGAKSYRETDVMYAVADISNQFQLLGWRPEIDINKGISYYLDKKTKQ